MRIYSVAGFYLCLAIVALNANTALAIEIRKSVTVSDTADNVWNKIGGFCTIQKWHPIVEGCKQTADGNVVRRVLTIAGGSEIKEMLTSRSSYTYSTKFEGGSLPVTSYRSTLRVDDAEGEAGSAKVTWISRFEAAGAKSDEARKVVSAIIAAGLIHIRRRINKTAR